MIHPVPVTFVEPAVVSDIDEMDRIEREAFNTPWSRELLRAAIINDHYQVRVLKSGALGMLGFYIAHDVKGKSNLDNLVVDKWARGRGHGSNLISDWIEQARALPADVLTLQVNTANKDAQRLYEQFELRTTRLLVSYYPNGEDAYQMVLNLNGQSSDSDDTAWGGLRQLRRVLTG